MVRIIRRLSVNKIGSNIYKIRTINGKKQEQEQEHRNIYYVFCEESSQRIESIRSDPNTLLELLLVVARLVNMFFWNTF